MRTSTPSNSRCARGLAPLGLLYLHRLNQSPMGTPPVQEELKLQLRDHLDGPFILARGFDRATTEAALWEHRADRVDFDRPFLANLDLVAQRGYVFRTIQARR